MPSVSALDPVSPPPVPGDGLAYHVAGDGRGSALLGEAALRMRPYCRTAGPPSLEGKFGPGVGQTLRRRVSPPLDGRLTTADELELVRFALHHGRHDPAYRGPVD